MSSDPGARSVAVVLLAAGAGTRLAAGRPKALVELGGVPLVRRCAEALAPLADRVVVVVPPGPDADAVAVAVAGAHADIVLVEGGARRRDSVLAGIRAARCDDVLVHDAARALVTTEVAARVLDAARRHGAAVPAVRVPDTLVRDEGGRCGDEVPRAGVHAVQTPQGFDRELLIEAHRAADAAWDAPDDGTMVRASGRAVALVEGDADNIKVTWGPDLARAERIVAARAPGGGAAPRDAAPRVGFGWDVHPLAAGRPTLLCGVVLAEDFGPVGHSDGDPLAHAVCDALLGAAALGDIGTLFPDTDARWKEAPGLDLLARTVAYLADHGFVPAQVDAVIVADAPKIGPSRAAIRSALAAVLGVSTDRVSLKGKRTEGLGGLSGRKGMACHAVAVVVRGAR